MKRKNQKKNNNNFGSLIDKALSKATESISFKIVFKAFNDSYNTLNNDKQYRIYYTYANDYQQFN